MLSVMIYYTKCQTKTHYITTVFRSLVLMTVIGFSYFSKVFHSTRTLTTRACSHGIRRMTLKFAYETKV